MVRNIITQCSMKYQSLHMRKSEMAIFDFLDMNSDYFIDRDDCIELKENISI